MSTPAFSSALDKPLVHGEHGHGHHGKQQQQHDRDNYQQHNIPLVQGIPVSQSETMPAGHAIFAGLELWIPPKPNVYQDGLPVYEVSREQEGPNDGNREFNTHTDVSFRLLARMLRSSKSPCELAAKSCASLELCAT